MISLVIFGIIMIIGGMIYGMSYASRIPHNTNEDRGLAIAFCGIIPLIAGLMIEAYNANNV